MVACLFLNFDRFFIPYVLSHSSSQAQRKILLESQHRVFFVVCSIVYFTSHVGEGGFSLTVYFAFHKVPFSKYNRSLLHLCDSFFALRIDFGNLFFNFPEFLAHLIRWLSFQRLIFSTGQSLLLACEFQWYNIIDLLASNHVVRRTSLRSAIILIIMI